MEVRGLWRQGKHEKVRNARVHRMPRHARREVGRGRGRVAACTCIGIIVVDLVLFPLHGFAWVEKNCRKVCDVICT